MLGNIHVTPDDLHDAAKTMQTTRNAVDDILSRTSTIIEKTVQDSWQDRAGDMLLERFRHLRTKYFHKYYEAMDEYAAFLIKTANDYEAEEKTRNMDIENLSNMGQK